MARAVRAEATTVTDRRVLGWGRRRGLRSVGSVVSALLALTAGPTAVVSAPADAITSSGAAVVAGPSAAASGPALVVRRGRGAVSSGRRYHTPTGAFFNNPRGTMLQRTRIERQIIAAIDHTPKGAYIRIAAYSFDRIPVADALIRAKRRGAHIQMLLDDHQNTDAMRMVRARIGSNRSKRDFIYECRSSCRGARHKRFLHTKFYTFTRTGRSRDVLMFGSANMTLNAVKHQWNDLYLMQAEQPLFDQYVALFDDMKVDYQTQQPSYTFCGQPAGVVCDNTVEPYTTVVFPKGVGPRNDPIMSILQRVQCITVTPSGQRRRTRLAIAMHTLRGNRGNYLSAELRRLWASGCNVRVDFGLIGFHTKGVIARPTRRGRIPLRSTGFDFNGDGEVDRYSHQKYLVIQGTYAGRPDTSITFTGSSNWAALGAVNDEILVSVPGARIARQYVANFDFEWRIGNSRNAYTTTYEHFGGHGSEGRPTGGGRAWPGSGTHWEGD